VPSGRGAKPCKLESTGGAMHRRTLRDSFASPALSSSGRPDAAQLMRSKMSLSCEVAAVWGQRRCEARWTPKGGMKVRSLHVEDSLPGPLANALWGPTPRPRTPIFPSLGIHGWVEDWRADIRLRWLAHGFHRGPSTRQQRAATIVPPSRPR
jgi:hypothetical protein